MAGESPYWNPKTETLGREQLEALQLAKLRYQCEWATARSPWYRRQFGESGFEPSQLNSVDDLRRVPLLTRDEWMSSQEALPPYGELPAIGPDGAIRVHTTSGTTGSRQPEASTLHGVRIATKRLRYLVEVVDEFEVPGSGESLAWLRGLQQHLGDWHDLEVMEGMLTEMLARPKFIRGHLDMASDVLRLIRRNRRRKKAFEEKYLQVTRHSAEYERTKQWATAQVTGYRLQLTGN